MQNVISGELGKKALSEVLVCCCDSLEKLCNRLSSVLLNIKESDDTSLDKLLEAIGNTLQSKERNPELVDAVNAQKIIEQSISDTEEPAEVRFWTLLSDCYILRVIADNAADAFKYSESQHIVEAVIDIAAKYDIVAASEGVSVLNTYIQMKDAAAANDVKQFVELCEKIPEDLLLRKRIGAYIKKVLLDTDTVSDQTMRIVVEAFSALFCTGSFEFSVIYDELRQKGSEALNADPKSKRTNVDVDYDAIMKLLCTVSTISLYLSTDSSTESLYSEASGLSASIASFLQGKKQSEEKRLLKAVESIRPENSAFTAYCKQYMKISSKQASFSFSGLFGKKKK